MGSTSAKLAVEDIKPEFTKKLANVKIVADKKSHQVIIEDATLEDAGEYSCSAGDVSTSAKLAVEDTKPEFTKKLADLKKKIKEKATFVCELNKEDVKVFLKKKKKKKKKK